MTLKNRKAIATLLGATVAGAFIAPAVNAAGNPFELNDFSGDSLHVAGAATQMKCGQGKCGAGMMKQGQGAQQANKPASTQPPKAAEGNAVNATNAGNTPSSSRQTPPTSTQSNPK
jgi:uncharacterized low-complexity protein